MLKPNDVAYSDHNADYNNKQRLEIEEHIDSCLSSAKFWPYMVFCTRAGWTLGNISDVLKAYEALGWHVTVDSKSGELATFDHPERAR